MITEYEWFASAEPYTMLKFLKGKLSERQLLLFTAHCVARHLLLPFHERDHPLGQAGTRFLNGEIHPTQFHDTIAAHYGPNYPAKLSRSRAFNAHEQSRYLSEMFRFHAAHGWYSEEDLDKPDCYVVRDRERQRHVAILREMLGNPFRPVAFADSWRSETVVALANGIYADRAFDRMPILADALEEAGCDHPDILDHCRGPGPHVRGCWVVDLVLNKS